MSAGHTHDHGHSHSHFAVAGNLLDAAERFSLGLRLTLALVCAGLLLMALGILVLAPAQGELAHLLAGVAAALVAIPVLREAWGGLRTPTLHAITDQLVAVAVLAAWVVGDLESAALVPLAMVIGHVLEERSLIGSQEAIAALGRLTRTKARRMGADGDVTEIEAEALRPGDRIEVRPGDRLGADGVVRVGTSSIDTSSLTGESVPTEVAPGDAVMAGAINVQGRIEVEVLRTGGDTTLGKVVALMREAERSKPPVTKLLERYAGHYLILILLIAAGVLFTTGNVTAMMTVLVAACPCALVLAAPATAIAAIAVAGRHGILVKGTAFLEELAEVDALIVDKTGTVTVGELRLVGVVEAPSGGSVGVTTASDVNLPTGSVLRGFAPVALALPLAPSHTPAPSTQHPAPDGVSRLRAIAASLGAASNHPVSRAVAAAVPVAERIAVSDITELGGKGLTGTLADGTRVSLGRAAFLAEVVGHDVTPPAHDGPLVGVAAGGRLLGWLLLADEPRAEARQALADLAALGLTRQILVTGDRRAVAERVAGQLGISEVDAEVLPGQKLARVQAELAAGRKPLVVGDGVNDALALKAGAVGVAMGVRGTDVALASADVVLLGEDLRRLGTCVRLARLSRRTININVALGLGWTFLVLAGGAAGLYGPLWAALLHNLGTLAVMANAGRLLRFDDRP